ncbi:MAG: hypothetical protein A2452_02460 [Candidatus Firestonebacteria bacterium RIFOXYC2_FULL_39_67]|nr:MAG: hypothetical protein A2536_02000 [Candidatus Firestonebacteria bacterium RIFOXYD2_FULL_39_29]OGF55184.1 MAG: hypothetical protein A2452_02460 [Candidatus Firestonebacteria bacterium RIFOXYC2_FULL_39_67]
MINKEILNPKAKNVEPISAGGRIKLENLELGKYIVEYWDTYNGEIKYRLQKNVEKDGNMEIKLPKIEKDIACKIKNINKIAAIPTIYNKEEELFGQSQNLTVSQMEDIERNLKLIEQFLYNKDYGVAKNLYNKLKAKYPDADFGYVNKVVYKNVMKRMK